MVTERLRTDLQVIFEAAVAAVDPSRLMQSALIASRGRLDVCAPGSRSVATLREPIGVIGAGKAAVGMAAAFANLCRGELDISGIVIAPSSQLRNRGAVEGCIEVVPGDHPVPGKLSEASSRRLLEFLEFPGKEAFVCLLSGGASSLLVSPIPPLTLAEKGAVTRLLLASGASIDEMNCVRKHLSKVKGGRLLRRVAGRRVVSLLISDVVGDDPATIGSGPAVPDRTTYGEAIEVLRARAILEECPKAVREILERGRRGEIEETVRPQSIEGRMAVPVVIGSNACARDGAAEAARQLGYDVQVRARPLEGDTTSCAKAWFREVLRSRNPRQQSCFIAGGETTVRLRGSGKGGRNQEFALALAEMAAGLNVALLSAGTDGIDGPTEAAGAIVDGATALRASRRGLGIEGYLRNNDSFQFFAQLGDLIVTGPTGTNVMDLKIALFGSPPTVSGMVGIQ